MPPTLPAPIVSCRGVRSEPLAGDPWQRVRFGAILDPAYQHAAPCRVACRIQQPTVGQGVMTRPRANTQDSHGLPVCW